MLPAVPLDQFIKFAKILVSRCSSVLSMYVEHSFLVVFLSQNDHKSIEIFLVRP